MTAQEQSCECKKTTDFCNNDGKIHVIIPCNMSRNCIYTWHFSKGLPEHRQAERKPLVFQFHHNLEEGLWIFIMFPKWKEKEICLLGKIKSTRGRRPRFCSKGYHFWVSGAGGISKAFNALPCSPGSSLLNCGEGSENSFAGSHWLLIIAQSRFFHGVCSSWRVHAVTAADA